MYITYTKGVVVMKIHIAICDDEKTEIDYLTLLLQKWTKQSKITACISTFNSAESFLFSYPDNKDYDIILLDIQMDKMNGVELAKKLRENNATIQIIFITGFPDFMAEGYEVSALHYLIKPIKEDKLIKTLNKAVEKLNCLEKPLFLTIDGETHRIPLPEIRYIEAQGHYILIKSTVYEYKVKLNLSEIQKSLNNSFFRCQRSFIVNLAYIKKITRTAIVMDDMTEIPISRGLYETANRAIIEYFQ